MADHLDSLSLNITASTTKAVSHINKLEQALNTLSVSLNSLNVGNLSTLTTSLDGLTGAMVRFKESGVGKADFTRLASSLNTLASTNTANLNFIGSTLRNFSQALEGFHIDSKATTGINTLANAINKLSTVNTAQLEANIPTVVNALEMFIQKINQLSAVTFDVAPISKLVNAMSKLASTDVTTVPQKLESVTKAILDMMKALQNAPTLSASVQAVLNALAGLGNVNVRATTSTNSLNTSLKGLIPTLGRTKTQFKGLVSMIGMFYARCFLAIRAVKTLWKSMELAMNIGETQNYFESSFKVIASKAVDTMGEAGEKSAEEYYNEYVKKSNDLAKQMTGFEVGKNGKLVNTGEISMGLNVREVKQFQSQFAQLSSSMNVASDYAVDMSNALTMIGADLASIRDENFTDVWNSLSSGIVGMSKAVDRFGINIRDSALQQELGNLGIDASIKKLGQQDKALLRTIVILKSSRQAWGDLAGTIQSPANTLKVLQSNLRQLGAMIGQVFIGFVSKAMVYINALVIALQRLVQYAMDIFNISLPDTTSKAMNGFEDLADSIYGAGDAIDDATGSVKKLKGQLLGLDELNNMTSKDDAGGGAGGLDGTASGALQKAFDEIYKAYQQKWNNAVAQMETDAQNLADKIVNAIKSGDWNKLGTTIANYLTDQLKKINWDKIYENAKKFGTNMANFFNGLIDPELFYQIGKTIAGYLNTQFYAIGAFVKTFDWKKAGLSLASMVKGFIDEIDATAIGEAIGGAIEGALKLVNTFLTATPWVQVGKKIGEFLKALNWTSILADVVVTIGHALVAVAKTLWGMILADPLSGIIVSAIVAGITVSKVSTVVKAISTAISSNSALSFLFKGAIPTGQQVILGMNTGIGKAWTSLGGIGGMLTTHFGEMGAMTSIAEKGLFIGTTIASSLVTAFVAYKVGEAIYHNLIEDTEWDAFGFDMREQMRIDEQAEIVAEQIRGAETVWNSALSDVASDLNWDALFKYEGQDAWADIINNVDFALKELGSNGVQIADTASALQGLDNISYMLDETSQKYVATLIEQYNQLDKVTQAQLAEKYGLDEVILSAEQAEELTQRYAKANEESIPSSQNNASVINDTATSLMNQKTQIEETIAKWQEFQSANGGSYESAKELSLALDEQKRILEETITYNKEYQKVHGGSYITAKALYDAEKELNEATGKNKEAVGEATGEYDGLITALADSSLSSYDFAGYMETLSSTDIPNVVDKLGDMNTAVGGLSDNLPTLKTDFENTFKQIKDDLDEVTDTKLPDFLTEVGNVETALSETTLPNMQSAFGNTVDGIITELDKIVTWFNNDFIPLFDENNILNQLGGLENGISTVFENVGKVIVAQMNKIIGAINDAFDISWDAIEMNGEQVVTSGNAKLINITPIQGFSKGGFINSADIFMANENGIPELVGTVGGRGAVASGTEITGIKDAIYNVASEIISEMRNNDTRVVLEGDAKGMFKQVRNQARMYQKSTGSPAFNF